ETYFKLYASTAKAIKAVSAAYRVGGPATAGAKWIAETVQYCAANQVPLDFMTTHDYGVFGDGLDEFGKKKLKLMPNPQAIPNSVKRSHDLITASALPKLELHITEWSSSYSNADPVHDTYLNAAYVLNVLRKTEAHATSMSYWTFTDIFEEHAPPETPFHGGFGLLNLQGIRKPTFYAYQFLHQLGKTELVNRDTSSYVCKDERGNVQALFWNLTMPDLRNSSNKELFRQNLPAKALGEVAFRINNLKPGRYQLEVYQTGYRQNDAFTAYHDLGLPAQLTKNQVAKLKGLSAGKPIEQSTITVAGSSFTKSFKLRENDVYFVKLNRL
ncbi:MAG: glycoside hydrolase, partial [Hymenobacter sp.]|nr:glycoside hydrolase [Hymenobacter sp.]